MEKKEKELAKLFHDTYERLAPEFGYTTREDTREFDENSSNGKLMIAVCREVILEELSKAREEGKKVTGETSDGYHTFNELYEHRHLLFSKLAEWKSKKHSDGTMFDGWFIAGIGKDKGEQITYHIPLRLWDSFNCEELDTAPEWDGHTANDVLKRLTKLTTK